MVGKWVRVGVAAAALAVPLAVGTPAAAQQNPFRWSGQLGAGKVLEVRGISGSIRTELASGSTAEVVAEKHGRSGDFDRVEIRVEQDGDGVTICSVYRPERNRDGCDNGGDSDRGRDHWRGDHDEIRVEVDYVVKLPAGVDFVGNLVSGDVDVVDVRSDVEASSVSGNVSVSTTGKGWGSTVSGDIDVSMKSLDWKDLDFHTVSGDITLRLPAAFAANVDFESISGDLDSDFDLTLTSRNQHRWVGSRVHGTVGDGGGRSLSLKTVSGDVRLLKM
jgi:Toastrack DUF4097